MLDMPSPPKPTPLRTVVFIDGENLRKTCYRLFDWGWCHPLRVATELVNAKTDRVLVQSRLYTGVPDPNVEQVRAGRMTRRLNAYEADGVHVVRRTLKYSSAWQVISPPTTSAAAVVVPSASASQTTSVGGGSAVQAKQVLVGREKGIDTRLALDLIRLALDNVYDLAIVVSGDSDMDEAVREVFDLRPFLGRWISVENGAPRAAGKKYVRLQSCTYVTYIDEAMFKIVSDNRVY